MIELHLDNVMRGIIEIKMYKPEDAKRFIEKLKQWSKLYHNEAKYTEFNQITEELYDNILDFRAFSEIQGVLKEVENEQKIKALEQELENCKEHNKLLAEQLSQSYIPSKDKGIGTT